jgi:MFS family permease
MELSTLPIDAQAAPKIVVVSPAYRKYAMAMLLAIYVLNFVDRQVINILAEPIKKDLGLLDWQIGAMSGLAFALFYTVLGLPIAQYAERGHRPYIISTAVAVWSGFTALCGLSQNFLQLVLARIGVGIGEAGCTPPAHSLITDYVPKEKRASALAFYSMGTPIGGLIGFALGGTVADAFGWRMAFIICAIPGLVLAAVAAVTLIEPRQQARKVAGAAHDAVRPKAIPLRQTLAFLTHKRTFWLIAFAASVKAFIGYGHAPFIASFFYRNHLEDITQLAQYFGLGVGGFLGLALGLFTGIAGAFGAYVGGYLADRFGAQDKSAYMSVPAIASLATIPFYVGALLVPDGAGALLIMTVSYFLGSLWYGPVYATGQSVVPAQMRATAAAILLFIINLIGLGLGPIAVGALSDSLAIYGNMGAADGVRWALILSVLANVAAFWFFWSARKTIQADIED